MKKISVTIDLDLLYDEINNSVTIDRINSIAQTPTQSNFIPMERILQITEVRYGILTLGSTVGRVIPKDSDIIVFYKDKKYIGHSHKSIVGRIDRLTSLISYNFGVNDKLYLEYDIVNRELKIIDVEQN